ncbi:chemotaxis protein, partial [Bacillus spizizenii]|nr:chemotaxis protein [Bacillus spizizenii]
MGKIIQWMKQPSISKPLIAAFLAVLILPVGVLAYFSYQSAWNALDRELTNSAMGNVEELNSTLQNKLNNKVKAIDYYSETIDKDILQGKNKTSLNEKFKQYTTLNADVGAIYVASEDKKLYKYPDSGVPKGFDPTGRDWYKQAVAKKGQAVFSEPYTDEATGDMVVTISKQLKDGSGVIALDLNLDEVL